MRVSVNGVRLFVDTEGPEYVVEGRSLVKRPTLLLLHGGPGFDHSLLKSTIGRDLAAFAHVVYLDQRGNGRSDDGDPTDWTLATWASDVQGVCEALGIERPIVFGVSFGAFVALKYAVMYPGLAAGIIAVSPLARYTREWILEAFEEIGGAEARAAARRNFDEPSPENSEEYWRVCVPLYTQTKMPAEALARVVRRPTVSEAYFAPGGDYLTFDLRQELRNVESPVLVAAGNCDPITPLAGAREVVDWLPRESAKLVTFSNAGHGVFWDAPEDLINVVRRFVLEVAGPK